MDGTNLFVRIGASLLGILVSTSVAAVTITFGTGDIDVLIFAGVQSEAGFEYQATSGSGWEVKNSEDDRGNPPSALATFFDGEGSDVGDEVIFTRDNGGNFSFLSVDSRTNSEGLPSDVVQVTGLRDGIVVGTMNPSITLTYVTTLGFDGVIDTLLFTVILDGQSAVWIDNLTLAPVPLPAAMWLLGSGVFTALGFAYSRNQPLKRQDRP